MKAYGPDHRDVGQTLLSYSAFLLQVDPKRSAEVAIQAAEIFEVKCINELIFPTSACVQKYFQLLIKIVCRELSL